MKNNKKKSKSNGQKRRHEDRLSTLPDEILINILSLLPTKFAVATSVLSPRWRDLWTQIDSLFLEFNSINHFKQNDDSFILTTITKLFTQITSPCIRKFTLHLSFRCSFALGHPLPNGATYLASWFPQLYARNVEQIQIDFDPLLLLSGITKLPPCVFQTPSLMVLDLGTWFTYELTTYIDNDEIINLPNLNKLRICFAEHSCKTFSKLIRSCPSLEDLSFSIARIYHPKNEHVYFDISSQSLKHLDMHLYWWFTGNTKLFVINAPKLVNVNVRSILRTRGLERILASLESCPDLEVLKFGLVVSPTGTIFTPLVSNLACVSTHLKRIEIMMNEIDSYDSLLQVVEYLLSSYGGVMEQLIININKSYLYHYDEIKSNNEKQLCEELYKLPRSLLLRCKTMFSGRYFEVMVPNGRIVMLSHWKEVHNRKDLSC